jgi:nucleoside-diphosphate-sugar epimerase
MRTALVTGVSGFIGRQLARQLTAQGWRTIGLSRRGRGNEVRAGDLTRPETLSGVCAGTDTVFHLAGLAHAADEGSPEADARHQAVTLDGTRSLLADAISQGVRRFVFVSSVKTMGEGGADSLDESAAPEPQSAYGRAKLEAERLVFAAGREHGMHVAVLRLPLVYGPGNKGNIPRMIAAIDRGRFPSLPETGNRRSMVHVNDVVQALLLAADNPAANGQVFIVTDGRTYSTRGIYEAICKALGRPVPGWSVPAWLLRLGARAGDVLQHSIGRPMPLTTGTLDKLLGSAWYSSDKIRRQLGFAPRHTLYDALPEIVAEYREELATSAEEPSGH